jgi:hypothetical protein
MLASLPAPARQAILDSLPPDAHGDPRSPGEGAPEVPGELPGGLPGRAFDVPTTEESLTEEPETAPEREGGWPAHWPGGGRS